MRLKLPELGEGVHEGELVRWLVKPGDGVKDDQVICEIMTDKATVEFPSPFHGKITELMAKEGEMVKVGQEILGYEGAGKTTEREAPKAEAPAPVAVAASNSIHAVSSSSGVNLGVAESHLATRVLAAPSTRRLARERGVDLVQVRGSGPAGRVMKEDVERLAGVGAVAAGPATSALRSPGYQGQAGPKHQDQTSSKYQGPAGSKYQGQTGPKYGEERVPFRGLRKKISEKMRLSKDKAAHFTYVEEADATELVNLRAQAKEIGAAQGVKVTYLPFIMKAMVAALRKYPILNSTLDEERGELVYKYDYNMGLSIQTDEGLTAPVVKDVANKSILDLAREIQNLVERARTKRLTLEDFQGGTITLTNAGSIGGLLATPIINYPEVAILGVNKIAKKPVVKTVNGRDEIVIREWTYFSISLDHRVVDGAVGAEFMKEFIRYIETPSLLLLESSLNQKG